MVQTQFCGVEQICLMAKVPGGHVLWCPVVGHALCVSRYFRQSLSGWPGLGHPAEGVVLFFRPLACATRLPLASLRSLRSPFAPLRPSLRPLFAQAFASCGHAGTSVGLPSGYFISLFCARLFVLRLFECVSLRVCAGSRLCAFASVLLLFAGLQAVGTSLVASFAQVVNSGGLPPCQQLVRRSIAGVGRK